LEFIHTTKDISNSYTTDHTLTPCKLTPFKVLQTSTGI